MAAGDGEVGGEGQAAGVEANPKGSLSQEADSSFDVFKDQVGCA